MDISGLCIDEGLVWYALDGLDVEMYPVTGIGLEILLRLGPLGVMGVFD